MLILIINSMGQSEIRECKFVPRVGDKLDVFYRPYPTVTSILTCLSVKTVKEIGVDAEAIVTVS